MMMAPNFLGSARARLIAYLWRGAMSALMLIVAMPATATGRGFYADFEVLCQVLDETAQMEKNEFIGGDTAVLRLLMNIPEDVYEDQIDVKVFAEIKVRGFKYRVKLPILDIDVPQRSKRFSIPGYTPDLQEFTPFRQLDTFNDVDFDTYVAVKIPDNVPNTKFTLRAIGSIKGHGKQSCKQTITLLN